MRVTVETFGGLKQYLPEQAQRLVLEVEGPVTVAALIGRLGFPAGAVWQVAVGGELTTLERVLEEGDVLTLFAPVEGG
jgi:sulfur carrier protein ThiS